MTSINLLSTRGLADRLETSIHTIRQQVRNGKLPPAVRTTSPMLWDAGLVDAWVAAGRPRDIQVWLANRERAAQ